MCSPCHRLFILLEQVFNDDYTGSASTSCAGRIPTCTTTTTYVMPRTAAAGDY
jgi:hypothetical protein